MIHGRPPGFGLGAFVRSVCSEPVLLIRYAYYLLAKEPRMSITNMYMTGPHGEYPDFLSHTAKPVPAESTYPRPSVGRIAHYTSYGSPAGEFVSECRAAIIVGLDHDPDVVQLAVFNPTGLYFNDCVYDEKHAGGTWHWPERV